MIKLIYPDDKWVSEDKLMTWAHDAFKNSETDRYAETIEDAITVLEDLGHIIIGA